MRSADASVRIFFFLARTCFPVPDVTQSQKPPIKCPGGSVRRDGPALGAGGARKGRSRFPLPRPGPGTAAPHPPRLGRGEARGRRARLPACPRPLPGQEEEEKAREVPAEQLGAGSREPSSPRPPPEGKRKGEPWRAAEDDNLGPCLPLGTALAARRGPRGGSDVPGHGRRRGSAPGAAGGEGEAEEEEAEEEEGE